ncbi:MAG: divalent metal cation transporter [Candidatus Eremiobacteraeota bacterium]|nr:divalent metal cation transporter [Candidatus Eremiobacteraeota bacterium]
MAEPKRKKKTSAASVPASELGSRETARADEPNPGLKFLRILGPGIIVGASDDDPSGIGTYAVAGAQFGYATLWLAPITVPLMAAVQYISAKIGLTTGEDLAATLRRNYPHPVVITVATLLVAANAINAGADIGAIAASLNLLVPKIPPATLVIPIGAALLALQIWGSYRTIAGIFKWLTLSLFAYVAAAFFAHPDWHAVLNATLIPHISFKSDYLMTLVAILGTTISPYMLFWQAAQEVEEDKALGRAALRQRRGTTKNEKRFALLDICVGMLFSNLVMYFIILTTGATLFVHGQHHIETAADAAKALVPFAGRWAEWLLAAGMIGAGALAVPVLTASSAYALGGAFGWKVGLSEHPGRAPRFYWVIVLSTFVGVGMNFLGIKAVDALFWTAVINGFLAPVVLAVLMIVSGNRKIMGQSTNGPVTSVLGWLTTGAMASAAIALVVFWGK